MQSQPRSHATKSLFNKEKSGSAELPAKSAKKLIKLTKPKTFKGPKVDVQNRIAQVLEQRIQAKITDRLVGEKKDIHDKKNRETAEKSFAAAHFIGSIELTGTPDADLNELIRNAKLTNLPGSNNGNTYGDAKVQGHAFNESFNLFDLVGGLENDIIENTLSTMDKAGQLDYLRKSDLINEDWKVVVEVHYYRDRDINMTGLHKDTLGQTLFVNLNFQNEEEISGPEFIINPNRPEEYEKIVSDFMPPVFIKDLNAVKNHYPEPDEFGASKIEPFGVVAFVDETIHHKTPFLGHRKVSAKTIAESYPDVKEAYDKYNKRWINYYAFTNYLDKKYHDKANAWLDIMSKVDDTKALYDRNDLAKMAILSAAEIDLLIEGQGYDSKSPDFNQFGSAKSPTFTNRMVVSTKPQLKRQMSQNLLNGTAPRPASGRRTFFRTWIRAVPTLNNQTHTIPVSDIIKKNPYITEAYSKYINQNGSEKKPFTDFLESKYHTLANNWLDIMSRSGDENARYFKAAIHPSIRSTLK